MNLFLRELQYMNLNPKNKKEEEEFLDQNIILYFSTLCYFIFFLLDFPSLKMSFLQLYLVCIQKNKMSSYQNEHFRPSIQPMVSLYAPPHYRLCIIKNKWKGFFLQVLKKMYIILSFHFSCQLISNHTYPLMDYFDSEHVWVIFGHIVFFLFGYSLEPLVLSLFLV